MTNTNPIHPEARETREDLAVKIGDLQPSTIWTAEANRLVDFDPVTGVVFVRVEREAEARAYLRKNWANAK